MSPHIRLAADIGGTFTDFILYDPEHQELRVGKHPSSPQDLSQGVLAGIRELAPDLSSIEFLTHGTTAGLNAFLERKGARTALITTEGFRDVYFIGRGNRPGDIYNLKYKKPEPLLKRRDIFEVKERITTDGTVATAMDLDSLADVSQRIEQGGYRSVAVCLLHAYVNSQHELAIRDYLVRKLPDVSVSLSHLVAREWREYERTSTTVMNAYISPSVEGYLDKLSSELSDGGYSAPLFVMQSTGGLLTSETARDRAVQTLMSGPVGGAMGGVAITRELNQSNLICIDMGGTSFDVSMIIEGNPDLTTEVYLEGFPLLTPMVNIHTIGAGGGSVAWIEGGGLRVGPQSAGADPGPACYGNGGQDPTVTDANLALGKLDPDFFLGGAMELKPELAVAALSRVAGELDLTYIELAEGICRIVNAKMAEAIREITVKRGIDPREFHLVAFGGAGPMHAVTIARELEMPHVVIPRSPGAFSAWGMLQTDVQRDSVYPYNKLADDESETELDNFFREIDGLALDELRNEHITVDELHVIRSGDLRYYGQEHTLTLALPIASNGSVDLAGTRRLFHLEHENRYGHNNPKARIEFVNLRVSAVGQLPKSELPLEGAEEGSSAIPSAVREVYFDGVATETDVLSRSALRPRQSFAGPAIVEEETCTTVLPPGSAASLDDYSNLLIKLN